MEYKLTRKNQLSYHDKDGCDRNYLSFYLNGVEILKQKIPFDTDYDRGYDRRLGIYDVYLLDGKIYQKRSIDGLSVREVKYPISRRKLELFGIADGLVINEFNG